MQLHTSFKRLPHTEEEQQSINIMSAQSPPIPTHDAPAPPSPQLSPAHAPEQKSIVDVSQEPKEDSATKHSSPAPAKPSREQTVPVADLTVTKESCSASSSAKTAGKEDSSDTDSYECISSDGTDDETPDWRQKLAEERRRDEEMRQMRLANDFRFRSSVMEHTLNNGIQHSTQYVELYVDMCPTGCMQSVLQEISTYETGGMDEERALHFLSTSLPKWFTCVLNRKYHYNFLAS